MITENYVSFETAKLLKKLGFDEECAGAYYETNHTITKFERSVKNSGIGSLMYSTPTLQMANKWLRENHHLWIDIDLLTGYKWTWSVWFMNDPNKKLKESLQTISKYEEAEDAAIKYCLENLIWIIMTTSELLPPKGRGLLAKYIKRTIEKI